MRKVIITALLAFTSLTTFSQDLWDTIALGGFGNDEKIYSAAVFNGQIYFGTQQLSPGLNPTIHYSSSANPGTFNVDAGFSSISNGISNGFDERVGKLTTSSVNGGYMFASADNFEDGAHIYRFDGANWINFSTFPPPYDSTYAFVKQLFTYSPGGGDDTLYAIIVSSSNGYSIFKSSVVNENWLFVKNYGFGIGFKDVEVFHDSIFFTDDQSNALFKFDGIDTVRAFTNPNSNSNTAQLAVFNNELYVSYSSFGTGIEIWKYDILNNWVNVESGGFGNGGNLPGSEYMLSFKKKLWLIATGSYGSILRGTENAGVQGGPSSLYVYRSDDGTGFLRSSVDGMGDYYNFGSEYELIGFNNRILCYGRFNSGNYDGRIYSLELPTTVIDPPIGNICTGSFYSFNEMSINTTAPSDWYVNNVYQYTGTPFNYNFPSAGTYLVSCATYNKTVMDSTHVYINVSQSPTLNGGGTNLTVCENTSISLGNYITSTNGTPPFSFNWFSGINNYVSTNPTHIATTSETFTVTLVDGLGCNASGVSITINTNPSTNLIGHVSTALIPSITNGLVYAFNYQPGSSGSDTADVAALNGAGDYFFFNLDSGNYLIKAIIDTTLYPLAIPTYHGNTFQWDSSLVFNHGCLQSDTANIQVLETNGTTGPGSISGYILEGPGYGQRIPFTNGNPIPFAPGGPIKGIDIKLGKNPGGGVQARTTSDSTGLYTFTNLPLQGYRIFVDIPNLPMDSLRAVVLSVGNPLSFQNNYMADSSMIYIDTLSVVGTFESEVFNMSSALVFPNPSSGLINIRFNEEINTLKITMIDLLGKTNTLFNESVTTVSSTNVLLDLSKQSLQPGIYTLLLELNGSIIKRRISFIEK